MKQKLKVDRKFTYASTGEILTLLGKGFLITVALTSPYSGPKLIKSFSLKLIDRVWEKYDQRRLRRTVSDMIKRKMLALNEADKETLIVVTEKGERQLLKYNIKRMSLEKPKVWDKKWRVVIFDVKEDKKTLRNSLRSKMKQLEFYQLQKSVYITPYPCEKEISFIRQYYLVGDEVSYFMATDLENEEVLIKRFGLE